MSVRSGFTLVELLVVLALAAVLLGITAPRAAAWRDGAAARAARDELASALAFTRLAAAGRGGASLWVDPVTDSFWTGTAEGVADAHVDLGDRYGVEVEVGSEAAVEIRFDALGIGRLSSRTVVLRRGEARRGLTVSAYGRGRRW